MKKALIILIVAAIMAANGCKKYDEGPRISLRAKKARIANSWKFEKVFVSESSGGWCSPAGTDLTNSYKDEFIEFKKDGSYIWTDGSSADVGSWIFASKKEDIVLTENGSSSSVSFNIIKLKNKQLWLRTGQYGNCGKIEFHLSPR